MTGTGNGKQIVLTTKGDYGSTFQNGFPLTNTSANLATNGAYMVIKPGTHTLRIRYWVQDVATDIEGTITKIIPSHTFAKNEYVNMEADLQIKNYDGDHYYMWDAEKQFWDGYEWNQGGSQPFLNGQRSNDYPKSSSDTNHRWYHEGNGPLSATKSCAIAPNVNELIWYALKGDPHGDVDELWTTMGHLYKGGVWLKKKSYINGFNDNSGPDGIDWRTNVKDEVWSISVSLPSAADIDKYFFLPFLGAYSGGYSGGKLYDRIGEYGYYWSSSALYSDRAYYLRLLNSTIAISYSYRYDGNRAQKFSDFGDN